MKMRHTCASILLMAAGMLVFTDEAVQAQVDHKLTKTGAPWGPKHPNAYLPHDRQAYQGTIHRQKGHKNAPPGKTPGRMGSPEGKGSSGGGGER